MKKLSALLMAILAITFTFTACGGRNKTDISGAKNIHDLKGATIAAQSGTFHQDALEQIDGITRQDFPDFTALLAALNAGTIDGYIAEEPTAYAECLKNDKLDYLHFVNNDTGFTATENDTGIAVGLKKGSDMTAKINDIIAGVPTETRENLMKQAVRMSAQKDKDLGEKPILVYDGTENINGEKTLKVAMECGYDPFNWTQATPANGAVAIGNGLYANGYDVQFAGYIADSLGMKLEITALDWESLIPAVQTGTIDCIMAGMSPTAERLEEIDFSDCYYTSNLVIIYKK